jgi:two-component system NtrC family sensor kinase
MYDFAKFTEDQLKECGTTLQTLGSGASNMEDAAGKIVRYLYDNITDPATGQKSCALVRFYKTHPYNQLDAGLQSFAQGILGSPPPSDDISCLTLLGTMGDQDQWKSRTQSNGHRAIPLANAEMVASIPMIARLISQFGIEVGQPAPVGQTRPVLPQPSDGG